MSRVSIIIVNYNTKKLTVQCIESIFKYTKNIDFEILLVDNNSNDGSKALFAADPRIIFIEALDNVGFGRANNLGYKQASGNFIFLLNSDTILYNNVIYEMVSFLEKNEHVGCVGTTLRNEKLQRIHSFSRFPLWYDEFIPIKRKTSNYLHNFPATVDVITGADIMIRRDVIEKYGLFDTSFFMYYEDSEMMFRYNKNGVKSVVVDFPGIIHLEGASSKVPYRKTIMQTRGFFVYISKTCNPVIALFAKIMVALKRSVTVWMKSWTIKEKTAYVCKLWEYVVR